MTQIDTKTLLDEIAGIAITTNGKPHIPRTLRDELVTHLLDTAPLSSEELETVLREAGYPVIACDNDEDGGKPYCWDNRMHVILSHMDDLIVRDLTKNKLVLSVPLSAVTRRLLRDCGVIG